MSNPILDDHYFFGETTSILKSRKYIGVDTFVVSNTEYDSNLYTYDREFIKYAEDNKFKNTLRRLIIGDESIPYADLLGCRAFYVCGEFISDYYPVFTKYDSFFKSISFVVSVNREPEFDETIKIQYHTVPNLNRMRPLMIPPAPGVHTCNCCVSGSACKYKAGRYLM